MTNIMLFIKKVLLILLVCFGTSLASCQNKIAKLELVKKNPIEYTFSIPKGNLFEVITQKHSFQRLSVMTINNKNIIPSEILEMFLKTNNNQDIFLWSLGAYGKSKIYQKKDGSFCDYRVSFYLHIEAVDKEKTKVSIITIDPRIVIRKVLLPSPPHFVRKDKTIPVEPSTIEEYEILSEIGYLVDEKDMPTLTLPEKNLDKVPKIK